MPSTLTTANMIAVGATQQDGNFWAGSNYGEKCCRLMPMLTLTLLHAFCVLSQNTPTAPSLLGTGLRNAKKIEMQLRG